MQRSAIIVAAVLATFGIATGATAGTLITSGKIKDGTVRSRDIKNGTIRNRDLKSSVIAPQGPQGEPGPPGAPGTPRAFRRVTALELLEPQQTRTVKATCETGEAISGGYFLRGNGTVDESRPTNNGWSVLATNASSTETLFVEATAVCVS